jgi:hypothetical protein
MIAQSTAYTATGAGGKGGFSTDYMEARTRAPRAVDDR